MFKQDLAVRVPTSRVETRGEKEKRGAGPQEDRRSDDIAMATMVAERGL